MLYGEIGINDFMNNYITVMKKNNANRYLDGVNNKIGTLTSYKY